MPWSKLRTVAQAQRFVIQMFALGLLSLPAAGVITAVFGTGELANVTFLAVFLLVRGTMAFAVYKLAAELASGLPALWAVGMGTVVHRVDGGWVEDLPPGGPREWWKLARMGSRYLVVGSTGGTAVYMSDAGWAVRTQPIGITTLFGVWTIDATAQTAWVVGSGPQIWLYNGVDGGFRSQNIMGTSGAFYDVWGAAPNDAWAVGDDGQAQHFDGTRWTAIDTGTRQKLERVRARALPGGGRELVIVGEHGTVLRKRY